MVQGAEASGPAVNEQINRFSVFYYCVTSVVKRELDCIKAQAWPAHGTFATKLALRWDAQRTGIAAVWAFEARHAGTADDS